MESIALPVYTAFAIRNIEQGGKTIVPEVVELFYRQFKGFYHAGTGRISGIRPLFRNLADGRVFFIYHIGKI